MTHYPQATPVEARTHHNVILLAIAQALGLANNVTVVGTASIIGHILAPEKWLASVPISAFVLGLWAGAAFVGWLTGHFGRRPTFQIGTAFGLATGIFGALGIYAGSFALFCVGAFCTGVYSAAQQAYRFAAADIASASYRPKAISLVLIGGVGGAIIGPQIMIYTQNAWAPYLFIVSYIAQIGLAIAAFFVLNHIDVPKFVQHDAHENDAPRPFLEIIGQPRFLAALACGVASYSIMNYLMTSAPLAMVLCGLTTRDASIGVQWHSLSMFAPSLVTGSLVVRFGVERIIVAGLAAFALSGITNLLGLTLGNFWLGLVLLGVGWNFTWIGAATMVTQCHRPSERNRVQAFNDFVIFGVTAFTSALSGLLLATAGWDWVNYVVFPFICSALLFLAWAAARQHRASVTG